MTRGRNRVLAVSPFNNCYNRLSRLVDSVHYSLLTLIASVMATRKVADHTLYHLSPKGFWKKFSTLDRALTSYVLT